jgi:hypothetical protein
MEQQLPIEQTKQTGTRGFMHRAGKIVEVDIQGNALNDNVDWLAFLTERNRQLAGPRRSARMEIPPKTHEVTK